MRSGLNYVINSEVGHELCAIRREVGPELCVISSEGGPELCVIRIVRSGNML